jgi:uncharacterized protein YqhQ
LIAVSSAKLNVGGQAVMEGVMMRSPRSLAVVCRGPAGELVVKEQKWRSLWERLRFLRWPFFRGGVVLFESLVNGMSALSFSAKVQMAGEEQAEATAANEAQATEAAEEQAEATAANEAQATEAAEEQAEATAANEAQATEAAAIGTAANEAAANEAPATEQSPHPTGELASAEDASQPAAKPAAEPAAEPSAKAPDLSQAEESAPSFAGVIAVSILAALALFVGLPHLLTALLGFSASSLEFHLVDGVIKVAIFVAYIAAIGYMEDIRRVFMYHGAEHKAIYTYERGLPMTVENARAQTRLHPRCGTSFILIVILISILLFAVTLRFPLVENGILDHLLKILIKVPLMLPVAGLSYEVLKLSARFEGNPLVRALVFPGLLLQRITTREPTDDQLEVALLAIEKTLWREKQTPQDASEGSTDREVEVFPSFEAARTALIVEGGCPIPPRPEKARFFGAHPQSSRFAPLQGKGPAGPASR